MTDARRRGKGKGRRREGEGDFPFGSRRRKIQVGECDFEGIPGYRVVNVGIEGKGEVQNIKKP